jgi:hypothetical protein
MKLILSRKDNFLVEKDNEQKNPVGMTLCCLAAN